MMNKKSLLYTLNENDFNKEILILEKSSEMRVLSNPIAWKIVNLLAGKPMYPAQIAKELKIYEQSAYYYIRKLLAIRAIGQVETSFVRGGTAKLYKTEYPAFGIEMDWGERKFENVKNGKINRTIRAFFENFVDDGLFNGMIVVGAPDPHGPYRSSARDGHYAAQLAFFLGSFCTLPQNFVVKLDVDAKSEKTSRTENIISIGGPGTNIITSEFNRYLPIRFDESNFWSGLIAPQGRTHTLDNHGLIARIRNPFSEKLSIIFIAGVRSAGTKSAIIALTNHGSEILKKFNQEDNWAVVVQGFDMDSDGKIDTIDIVNEVSTSSI
jgi:S-layer like family, C-terminal region